MLCTHTHEVLQLRWDRGGVPQILRSASSVEGLLSYKTTRRHWVKLWVGEWLDGTTRFELTPEQRLLWVDLLALAGRSRFPGMIYPGVGENDKKIGYPISYLAGVLSFQPGGLREALTILERHGHILIDEPSSDCFVISISNWDKYQSEYQRQKLSRSEKVRTKTRQSAQEVTPENTLKLPVEGEKIREEEDGEKRRDSAATVAAFNSFECQPFGGPKFKQIWTQEYENHKDGTAWADTMERAIEICQSNRIKVPGRFFAHKREIEKVEAENAYKRTPL
jgi:hypothetical protein